MAQPLTRAKAILHPVRARVLVALQDRRLTPQQLVAFLEDVPQTTLYRHVNVLLEAGLIRVCEERRVQRRDERVLTAATDEGFLTEHDRAQLTAEDVLGLVEALTGTVRATFGRYVRHTPMPPPEGDISILARSLTMSDEDYQALRQQVLRLMRERPEPTGGGSRRLIGFFSAPDLEAEPLSGSEGRS